MKQQIKNNDTAEDKARKILNQMGIDVGYQLTAGDLAPLANVIHEKIHFQKGFNSKKDFIKELKTKLQEEKFVQGVKANQAICKNESPTKYRARKEILTDILEML